MTFIHHSELKELRDQGLSPKGGPLPGSERASLLDKDPFSMSPRERLCMLDKILAASWHHPLDPSLRDEVIAYTGGRSPQISSAKISDAAEFIHNKKDPRLTRERTAYNELAALARDLDRF